jgi:hypothetical protein
MHEKVDLLSQTLRPLAVRQPLDINICPAPITSNFEREAARPKRFVQHSNETYSRMGHPPRKNP